MEDLHRCHGCVYDDVSYMPECEGCRMKDNLEYNTEDEEMEFKSLPIKYIAKDISYGTHKLLVKK